MSDREALTMISVRVPAEWLVDIDKALEAGWMSTRAGAFRRGIDLARQEARSHWITAEFSAAYATSTPEQLEYEREVGEIGLALLAERVREEDEALGVADQDVS